MNAHAQSHPPTATAARPTPGGVTLDVERVSHDYGGFRALDAEMSIRRRKCLDFLARPRSHDLLLLGSSRVFAISMSRAATRGIASVALQAQQNS